MSDMYCTYCKKQRVVLFDHAEGHTVCSECAFILESGRHFTYESEPVCIDGPTDDGLSTVIAKSNAALRRWKSNGVMIEHAFHIINTLSDRLGLAAAIKDRAKEIYLRVKDQKPIQGSCMLALNAACLSVACQQEGKPCTVKEICSVAIGARKKDICRLMGKLSGQSVEMGNMHAGDYMRRFCHNLGMNNQALKAAQEAAQKSEEFGIRRSPSSIAAAIVYIITQLSDDKKPVEDISLATGVAELNIGISYKHLYPHVSKLIPDWYAKEEELKNLCSTFAALEV